MKNTYLRCEDEIFTLIMLAVDGVDVLMLPLAEIFDRQTAFELS